MNLTTITIMAITGINTIMEITRAVIITMITTVLTTLINKTNTVTGDGITMTTANHADRTVMPVMTMTMIIPMITGPVTITTAAATGIHFLRTYLNADKKKKDHTTLIQDLMETLIIPR